ncbi:MAG: precorrin-6Y C5,15-methyltransferase (decarboxylating) subunit CbiT, partial [bacterium]|nr:precorrin-6Y C5,15-methyltransferase (decarboxylating) subunit CbiT [bacterium]
IACCEEAGIGAGQLIGMQGPFSVELNAAMFREKHAKILITKASGAQGGYVQKLRAAVDCGMDIIIIHPPKDEGFSMSEVRAMLGLSKTTDLAVALQKKQLMLVGIGMGQEKSLTGEAREAFAQAQIIFGAGRMLESVAGIEGVSSKISDTAIYMADDVCGYLKTHPHLTCVAVALSGDVGFYSGAKQYYEKFRSLEWEITSICGVSSVSYFSSKLGIPWQSMKLCSRHGKAANIVSLIKRNRSVFALFSNTAQVHALAERLIAYEMNQVTMHIGWDLGYCSDNRCERIKSGFPEAFLNETREGLCVGIFENPYADESVTGIHADTDYERMEKIPMTKEEVRALILSKLQLQETSIVYDIGAGTGGVTMDLAHYVTDGSVYAIERNERALSLLERNVKHFGAESVHIISGMAPEVLEHLPAPTHVFIGGSAGRLAEIVECLYQKNSAVRIVIAAVTLETIAEVTRLVQEGVIEDPQICQVSVARAKTAGSYHLMSAENPVYLITILP